MSPTEINNGRIIRIERVRTPSFTTLKFVLYVDGLKHNLLSISQLCDKGLKINFNKDTCFIQDKVYQEFKLVGNRISNIYMISIDDLSFKLKFLVVNITMMHDFGTKEMLTSIWII